MRLLHAMMVAGAGLLPLLGGCASGAADQAGTQAGAGMSTTPAEIILRREQNTTRQFVFFHVTAQRRLTYTAGRRAMRNEDPYGQPNWTGVLSPEVYAELTALARAAEQGEPGAESPDAPTYRLTVKEPGELFPGERVGGPTPALDALYRRLLRIPTEARADELDPERFSAG
jgi:hypothetical protein